MLTSLSDAKNGVTPETISSKYAFDIDKYMELAKKGQILEEAAIKIICAKVKEVLAKEENVVRVAAPVTVVGDVHG